MITPNEIQPKLAGEIGVSSLFFKREDLHPLGSHKGRSIPYMINHYAKKGLRHFAISSSGNAALAAALHIKKLNETNKKNGQETSSNNASFVIEIFAGKNINLKKLAKLQELKDDNILISIQEKPLQVLFARTQDPSIQSLRQSTDEMALEGYKSLAEELLEIPDLKAVFIAASSGTTGQALAQYFAEKGKKIEVHIVQTTSCHPMSEALLEITKPGEIIEETDEKSIADAIVDKTAFRKEALISLLKKSSGQAWIANNESIRIAQDVVKKNAVDSSTGKPLSISTNSALSVAGLMNAVYTGSSWKGSVVCIIAGE